ncbi:hypothetical protein Q31b_41100 [Novipirellula aureliae]|uniref:Uncharacterized protein n=1 Tax=Novipirellula aureliae TaxID=2527966 RepID=A0A5C6DW27_9BACT|nr:hypothetical protein [Novipirellula aureliae]TWU39029.1 hypothetical protein Q31b_41100 [Novipirellula aureliae]
MRQTALSENSRKALMINIGEAAGREVADLIAQMAAEIEELRRSKVSVTRIVPGTVEQATFVEEPV